MHTHKQKGETPPLLSSRVRVVVTREGKEEAVPHRLQQTKCCQDQMEIVALWNSAVYRNCVELWIAGDEHASNMPVMVVDEIA